MGTIPAIWYSESVTGLTEYIRFKFVLRVASQVELVRDSELSSTPLYYAAPHFANAVGRRLADLVPIPHGLTSH